MKVFKTIGELSAKPFTYLAEGFLYVCRDWNEERHIKEVEIFSKQCDLLESGFISRQEKIRFLEAEYFRCLREKKSTHEIEHALEYFHQAESKDYKRNWKQKQEAESTLAWVLGHLILLVALVFLNSEFTKFNETTCHPNKNTYRNSAYCLKLKQINEFFVGE